MKSNVKNLISIILIYALIAGCFVTLITPTVNAVEENSATNWTLYDSFEDEATGDTVNIAINIKTEGTGNNLKYHVTLFVDDMPTISTSFNGNLWGNGKFDAYILIGGYIVLVPLQGNEMGKNNKYPQIVAGEGSGHDWVVQEELAAACETEGYIGNLRKPLK